MRNGLKTYAVPWDGRVVLACKKCQKKIKEHDADSALGSLKKAVKRSGRALHVVHVGCMDFCPKGGVAVCVPGGAEDRVVILRRTEDIDDLG